MRSLQLFPKEERATRGKYKRFSKENFEMMLQFFMKYGHALDVAEGEAMLLGITELYSNKILDGWRVKGQVSFGFGKFPFYALKKTIEKYHEALKSTEKQIEHATA